MTYINDPEYKIECCRNDCEIAKDNRVRIMKNVSKKLKGFVMSLEPISEKEYCELYDAFYRAVSEYTSNKIFEAEKKWDDTYHSIAENKMNG